MYNREIRDYEVSIWTLQDSFIAVLKASKLENKGHIQDPKMVIKDDGTREFSFSLPMYLYDGPDKKENPIWYTVRNGNLLVNMRKIKVIFNKMTKNEEVFEFIITKVTESHEDDELTCDVECEGLAFHELGKIGYKISLGQDDFLNEYKDWADGKIDEDEPHATLNYWCDKVLKNSKWTYCVRMDWAAYDGLIPVRYIGGDDDEPRFRNLGWGLVDKNAYLAVSETQSDSEIEELVEKEKLSDSSNFELLDYFSLTDDDFIILNAYKKERNFRLIDKIYEDEYVSSWNVDSNSDVLTPASVEKFREKERIIDVKESNIYNITQTIAETFGVFCRYEYEYDTDYHIIGRRIIFYNNFIQEATGTIDLNYSGNDSSKFTGAVDLSYPYNTSHIEREMDGTDIITKMFVKNLSDNASDSGLVTIMDTDANKSGEDYLLNFDYMYSIGTISQEQYDAIPKFEKKVKEINNQLVPLSNHITYLENELNNVKADKTIAENSIALDNERLEAADQAMKAVTQDANSNPDPNNPGAIMVTENRPDYCYLIIDRGINGRYIKLTYSGVLRDTLKLYETYNRMGTTGEKLSKQLESGYEVEEDEYGNITRIIINATLEDNNNTLYATYSYKPDLYYENIKKLWNKRLKDDQEKLDKAKSRIEELEGTEETEGQIEKLRNDYNDLITQKEKLIARFERMMGPALREGNWQPEDDYANYGDKKTVVQRLDLNSVFNNDVEISIGWEGEDKLKGIELFDGEDKSYHLIGADTTREYYPFINLENNFDIFKGKEELKQYSFCFYDKDLGDIDDPAYYKYFAIGSRSRLGFLKINDEVKPVLFLSDTDSLPAKEKILNPFIGKITVKETEGQNGFEYNEERLMDVINIDYSQNEIVYPRIQICSSRLKVSEDQLSIYFGNKLLKNYEDYYINSRTNDDTYLTTYYITIKPEFLFKNGFGDFTIHYAISNTGLIMYLDAIQVLKENAYPQVSYTIDPSLVNKNFTHLAYKTLNKIVHINDYELKFENILGYISELELDLDHPWEDSITITNYKTKFEDLFSTIVAQTEDMKKNSYIISMAASAFTDYGTLSSEFMQNSINKPDLSYAFNNGKLTIDNENGIWGISDDGVVAMRGGGIFTANEQDGDGNWIWNTGILPSGINASLITTGQLDTNLIRIFAGDDLRFQMNGDGIFAYKDDAEVDDDHPDAKYYARYYSEGLFLHVDDGVKVADDTYVKTKDGKGIDRVELSWNGLILRDWNNEKTLSTDPDTGNLTVRGNIQATGLTIVPNGSNENGIPIDSYINQNSSRTYYFPSIQEENSPDTGDESPIFINGDLWINTSDSNKMYRYNQEQEKWILVADTRISNLQDEYNNLNNSKNKTYLLGNIPEDNSIYNIGDLLINTSQKNKLYRFNGKTWISIQDTGLTNFDLADGASILSVIENNPYDFGTHKPSISLNTNNGLLIKGKATTNITTNGTEKSYPFFQVTSKGMGFFKYNQSETDGVKEDSISNLLYYNDGNLTVTGTIQASSGWLGGNSGWKIQPYQIRNYIESNGQYNANEFILTTNYELYHYEEEEKIIDEIIPALILSASDNKSLILNRYSLSVGNIEENNLLEQINETINLDFKEGEGRFNNIYANNIKVYHSEPLIMRMMEDNKINTFNDFIENLKNDVYPEAEYIINGLYEKDENDIFINKSPYIEEYEPITFENILTPIIKISCYDEPVLITDTTENDGTEIENQYYQYNSIIPPIIVKSNNYFIFTNIIWDINLPIDDSEEQEVQNENETISYMQINKIKANKSFGILIENCNANVYLQDCWFNNINYGLITYGGRIGWFNSKDQSNLRGECNGYFSIAGNNGIISISGQIPQIEEEHDVFYFGSGRILTDDGTINTAGGSSSSSIKISEQDTAVSVFTYTGRGLIGNNSSGKNSTNLKCSLTNSGVFEQMGNDYSRVSSNSIQFNNFKNFLKEVKNNKKYSIVVDKIRVEVGRIGSIGYWSNVTFPIELPLNSGTFYYKLPQYTENDNSDSYSIYTDETTRSYFDNFFNKLLDGPDTEEITWVAQSNPTYSDVSGKKYKSNYAGIYTWSNNVTIYWHLVEKQII